MGKDQSDCGNFGEPAPGGGEGRPRCEREADPGSRGALSGRCPVRGLIEVLRRVVLLIGIVLALWFVFRPAPALIKVSLQDFAADLARKPCWESAARLTPEEFAARETRERGVSVGGPQWEALYDAARSRAEGREVAPVMRRRAGRGFAGSSLFFSLDEPPVSELAGKLNDDASFAYLILGGAGAPRYLQAVYVRPSMARHQAPSRVLYPLRRYGPWILLAALLLYVLVPFPPRTPDSLTYSRVRASILPDLIGTILTGFFFALPLFVIPATAPTPDLLSFERGWGVLTIVCWLFALFGISFFVVSSWYAAFRLQLLPDRLRKTTLAGIEEYPYAEMVSAGLYSQSFPRWLLLLGLAGVLMSWRVAAPFLLAWGRDDKGLEIKCRGGRGLRLPLTALDGTERVLAALKAAGVPMDPELESFVRNSEVLP